MQFVKCLPVFVLAMAIGCAQGPKPKTATEQGVKNWNMARAGVMYNLAREQFESGNLEDARKSLNNAAKMAPEHPLIPILSAKLCIEQGQLEVAVIELNRARSLDAKNAEVDYLEGVINQRWNKPDAALSCYIKAREKNPLELAYLLAQAETLVSLDSRPAALKILREKLSFFENSPAIRDAVGQLLVEDGKFADAVPMLRQASILAPDEQLIREHYALSLFYNKDYREAAIVFDRLLKEEKYNTRADLRTAAGECKLALDRPRDARDDFELAAQIQPDLASAWLNIAKCALQLNDLKRAEISLKKAMAIEPKSADVNLLMGYLRLRQAEGLAGDGRIQDSPLRQSKLEDALVAFRKASSMDPNDPVSLCMSGFVLEKMGRSNEAIGCYSQALKLKPNDEMATTLLAKVQAN